MCTSTFFAHMNVSVLQTSWATVFLRVGMLRSVSSLSLLEGIIIYLSREKQRILQHGKHVRWQANFLTSSAVGGSRAHTGLGFRRVQKVWMQPSLPGGVFIASSFESGCLLSHIRRGFAAASACELVQGRILQAMLMPPHVRFIHNLAPPLPPSWCGLDGILPLGNSL